MRWLPCIIRSPYNFPKILPCIFCNVIPVYGSHLSKTECRHTLELLNAQFHYFLLVMYISITKINWILIKQLMNHNKLYSKGLTLSPAFSLGWLLHTCLTVLNFVTLISLLNNPLLAFLYLTRKCLAVRIRNRITTDIIFLSWQNSTWKVPYYHTGSAIITDHYLSCWLST